MWQWYAEHTNPNKVEGSLREVIQGADVFIGLSAGGLLRREDVQAMAKDPIVFAMANPTPEIKPEEVEDIVGVIATGRSDYRTKLTTSSASGYFPCDPGLQSNHD